MDIQSTPEKPLAENYDGFLRLGLFAIIFLLGGAVLWAFLAHIKGAVIAPGTLVVESKPKVIQHLDGGIVGEIFVKDGDSVSENQLLMRLDPTMLEANRSLVETRYYESLARVARLEAERDDIDAIIWPVMLEDQKTNRVVQVAMLGQEKLFEARVVAAKGLVRQLRQRIAQNTNQIEGLRSLILSQNSQVNLLDSELADLKVGLDKGVVTRARYNSMARERTRIEGDMARNGTEIARLRNAITETEVEILQAHRERQESILTELRSAQTEASDFREQLTSAADQRRRIDVRSPSDGVVHNLLVTTIGGVVQPGQDIMQIIPQNDRLIVDAQVQPQDIDQIYEGQPARIRFSALNARRTPELNGTVLKSSPDRLVDQVTGLPYYSVKLIVPPAELERLQGQTLLPGMPAEAFMQTQSRSVISYLIKPASDAMSRSFREE